MNNVSLMDQLVIVVNASIICIYYRKIQTVVIDGMLFYSTTLGWAWFVDAFSIGSALRRIVCSARFS